MTGTLSNRGIFGLMGAALAGIFSAALYHIAISNSGSLLTYLSYVSPLPLFMSGLGAGILPGLLAAALGALALTLNGGVIYAAPYTAIIAIPVVAICALALRNRKGADEKTYWYPEGLLLSAVSVMAAALLVVAFVAALPEGGLFNLTAQALQHMIDQSADKFTSYDMENIDKIKNSVAKMLPSLLAGSWMMLLILNATVAQSSLQQHANNIRDKFSLADLRAPQWVLFALALSGAGIFAAPEPYDLLFSNICAMFSLPVLFQGISVTHAYAGTKKHKGWLLFLFYALLTVLPVAAILVVLLGAIDQAFDFRRHLIASKEIKND